MDKKFQITINEHQLQLIAACIEDCAALSFPTEKMAKEFLDTFRELIEEAKILI